MALALPSVGAFANEPPSAQVMWEMIQKLQKENMELRALIENGQKGAMEDKSQMASQSGSEPKAAMVAKRAAKPMQEAEVARKPDSIDVSVHGFIRAEYGNGDRYSDADGSDRLGVQRSAIAVKAKYQNVTGVLAVGTEIFSGADENGTFDGNVDVKDAFVVVENIGGSNFGVSLGAQPLLFGLKPAGYPGDRSLQESIEYGGAGAFAVSNQLGPSIIGFYNWDENTNLRFGAFDLRVQESNNLPLIDDGSSLTDNLFIQLGSKSIAGTNWYGNLGFEQLYVGNTGDSETIWSAGLGWRNDKFDVSAEYISLDQAIAEANLGAVGGGSQAAIGLFSGDESYLITELTYYANEDWTIYFDYATADELDADTLRLGATYRYNKVLSFTSEYSNDDVEILNLVTGERDDKASSVDFRATIEF